MEPQCIKGNAEDCPVHQSEIGTTILYPWVCPDDPARRDQEMDLLRTERNQYAAAIRHLIQTVKWTAYEWGRTQPEFLRREDVVRVLSQFAEQPRPLPDDLRDDLWQRIAGAYYLRFESDGHPEDSTAAADVAMRLVQPELDTLQREIDALDDKLTRLRAYLASQVEGFPTGYPVAVPVADILDIIDTDRRQ